MSNMTYNILWASAQEDLLHLVKSESPDIYHPIVEDRFVAIRQTATLYLKYIKVTNQLITCHENIVQPQKRFLLRKLVDATIGRVLELKQGLVNLEFSEFHFLDQILLDLRMTPDEMNVKIPLYFTEEVSDQQKKRRDVIKHYLQLSIADTLNAKMTIKEAIHIIKIHEKARQGRLKFLEAQKSYEIKRRTKLKEERRNQKFQMTKKEAALKIQNAWKKFQVCKQIKEESELLENIPSLSSDKEKIIAMQMAKEIKQRQREMMYKNEAEFLDAVSEMKKVIYAYRVPVMIEELQDRIRSYFHNYRKVLGDFPVFPTEEEGGSTKMLEDMSLIELDEKANENAEKGDSKEPKQNGDEPDSEDNISDDDGQRKIVPGEDENEEEEITGFVLKPSKFIPDLLELVGEYQRVWANKPLVDVFDSYDEKMIEEDILKEVELHVRIHADATMREELLRLNEAFEKDSGKKAKKGGKGKGGKKDKKKEKGKDKGKAKKEKDLTPHRSFESLVEELVEQRIIKDYPYFRLSDYIGEYNCIGSIMQMECDPLQGPSPCLGDVRRVVNEYCILPMGSSAIHSKGPYVSSILFAGPHGMGKESLVYAICNEIGATLMDLSAGNIDGKYPGKEGLDMLMHLVSKVGRLSQPTVIYIKDAENCFWKKKPPTCSLTDPGRLKKVLPKFVKEIGVDARILICGTTVTPFDVDLKGLDACYNKIICIYKPDYNCRRALWRELVLKYDGILTPKLDLTTLCTVSDGFTAPQIKEAVTEVLNQRRMLFLNKIPLDATEFTPLLANYVPVYDEEEEAYKAWLAKLPLQKKRIKMLEEEAAKEEYDEDESGEETE